MKFKYLGGFLIIGIGMKGRLCVLWGIVVEMFPELTGNASLDQSFHSILLLSSSSIGSKLFQVQCLSRFTRFEFYVNVWFEASFRFQEVFWTKCSGLRLGPESSKFNILKFRMFDTNAQENLGSIQHYFLQLS